MSSRKTLSPLENVRPAIVLWSAPSRPPGGNDWPITARLASAAVQRVSDDRGNLRVPYSETDGGGSRQEHRCVGQLRGLLHVRELGEGLSAPGRLDNSEWINLGAADKNGKSAEIRWRESAEIVARSRRHSEQATSRLAVSATTPIGSSSKPKRTSEPNHVEFRARPIHTPK